MILDQVVRIAAPYVLAATAGVLAERSGTIDIALEGKLLVAAFGTAIGSLATGSALLGLGCGIGCAMLLAGVQALATVRLRANHVVIGVACNLLAAAATRFLLRLGYGSSSNSPRFADAFGPGLLVVAALLVAGTHLALSRTVLGLRLRAAGEHPEAAESLGVRVGPIRLAALMLGAAVVGTGGALMAFEQHGFVDGMSGGRGFIAIAALVLGRWRPLPTAAWAVGFATAEAGQIALQSAGIGAQSPLLHALPHALTVIALAGAAVRATAPRALGQPPPER